MAEEEDDHHITEKQEIQQYMQQYCLEECLDEIMNDVVLQRPQNPYLLMSTLFESKTLPEFIGVDFKSVLLGGGVAVKATLITNIAEFSAICAYEKKEGDIEVVFKDYSSLQEKIRDAVIDINPTDLQKFDDAIAALSDIDPAESMSLSIACCKAASRHKAIKLHRFIAEVSGTRQDEMSIPVPVVSVLSRIIPGSDAATQDFTVTPVRAATFGSALQKVMTAANAIAQHEEVLYPKVLSAWGSPCTMGASAEVSGKLVKSVLQANGLAGDLKQGIHFRAGSLLKQPATAGETNPQYSYLLEGPTVAARSSADVVEITSALWQELEFITAEDILFDQDYTSYQQLNKRIQETIYDAKQSADTGALKYNASGVGGDSSCSLQVLMNPITFEQLPDPVHFKQTMPQNCIKLQLNKFSNISQAIALVKKAKAASWPIAICSSDSAEQCESSDTFIADFAVGVGAGQFMSGGVFAAECCAKYNRLLEIQSEDNKVPYAGSKFRVSIALH